MTVYVDELFVWPKTGREWCHMIADDPTELDTMAHYIGLRRSWKHGDHYDLTPGKRRQAIKAGAVEVDAKTIVDIRKKLRKA